MDVMEEEKKEDIDLSIDEFGEELAEEDEDIVVEPDEEEDAVVGKVLKDSRVVDDQGSYGQQLNAGNVTTSESPQAARVPESQAMKKSEKIASSRQTTTVEATGRRNTETIRRETTIVCEGKYGSTK